MLRIDGKEAIKLELIGRFHVSKPPLSKQQLIVYRRPPPKVLQGFLLAHRLCWYSAWANDEAVCPPYLDNANQTYSFISVLWLGAIFGQCRNVRVALSSPFIHNASTFAAHERLFP